MTLLTEELPESLAEAADEAWHAIRERCDHAEAQALERAIAEPAVSRQLARVLACSRFAADTLRSRPWLLEQLLISGVTARPLHDGELDTELADLLRAAADSNAAGVTLRRFRQRQMLRIIWRDLNRLAPTMETTRDVSSLADACIGRALAVCTAELEARFGVPTGKRSGERQELIVLAMGKLGAGELNLSSDVDLIFAYPESGETQGARRSLSNEEFFTRLGRALIAALDPITAEGFVFRVDMRLRPYGESGALVHSFAALESYYQEQGRDWERYAMIKARPVTGSLPAQEKLRRLLMPFVYRRYVDFSAIESLRSMKKLIVAEVRRRELSDNVKLGSGGIREIEFIAQCFQLIRGGRDVSLQRRELLPVLEECASLGSLPPEAVQELAEAYRFLRDTEHAVQAWEDRQTQDLPRDSLACLALAHCMGFADYPAFREALEAHRGRVAHHFSDLIEAPEQPAPEATETELWGEDCDESALSALGFADPAASSERIESLFNSRRVQFLQAEGRARLDRFMPLLVAACSEVEDSDLALERTLPLVAAVLRRSVYLLLLIENPPALSDLVRLCAASPWIAESLTHRPALLDELLDRASLYTAPDREALGNDLRQQLLRLSADDLEGYMEALRYFKASQVLRVAASETSGRLPLMKVSDKLTFIAEVCLSEVLEIVWTQLVSRYGEPERDGTGRGFAVVAYGKLGGIELSYASDLDLVFIFDAPSGGYTRGERSIDNATFYTRLGQRIIHVLETRMVLGQLYEVDMRLRPSGASGLLVSRFDAFERYQRDEAWTWEHQALVRARAICGDPEMIERVEALRRDILCAPRDAAALAGEVVAMREKMRSHAGVARDDVEFDLKQGCGGIVDIEFMVQYAVLAWAQEDPELAHWPDNVRILETLAGTGRSPLEPSQCQQLTDAYLALRSATHQLALQHAVGKLPAANFAAEVEIVCAAWETLFGVPSGAAPPAEAGSNE